MTPTPDLKAAALATGHVYPDWPAMMEGLKRDGYVSFFTDFIAAADPTTVLALIEHLQVAEDAAKASAELIDTLTKALKAARVPIASDCESFSTHREVLTKIDAAIAARRMTP